MSAGRTCPSDYWYGAQSLARNADFSAEVIYVVGGLYGNSAALDAIEILARAEDATLVFNGDFHWFDRSPDAFAAIHRRVLTHRALRGNIETELSRETDAGAGCGCAYPPEIDQDVVDRSNQILALLSQTVAELKTVAAPMRDLPMTTVARVGALRVGIVHGDADTLAGWRFSTETLGDAGGRAWLESVWRASQIDVFASSHTCLPALREFSFPCGHLVIVNNGAAGMPNFEGCHFGLITRIGVYHSPHPIMYGVEHHGVFIDALPIHFDHRRWLDDFQRHWPRNSPAYESYFERICNGPPYSPEQAFLRVPQSTSEFP